jgi:hypothetical protein
MTTSDLVRFYDEVLRELHGPDYADQAETLHELEHVIRTRTGHDVRCSALRGGSGCDRRCDAANQEKAERGQGYQADAAPPRGHELEKFTDDHGGRFGAFRS